MVALAVHGVSNRNPASFQAIVAGLEQAGGPGMPHLEPVFWGDLGPPDDPLSSVPTDGDTAVLSAPDSAFASAAVGDAAVGQRVTELTAATVAVLAQRTGAPVPDATVEAVRAAVAESAVEGNTLALQ